MMDRKNGSGERAGFTLTELLVVVAIIGVLVAVSIPIFASQIHKSRVATDWANVRSYYAELTYEFQQTGVYDTSKECGMGMEGLKSFTLGGTTVKLKTGRLWVAPVYEDPDRKIYRGYNLMYICNDGHDEHELMLG